MRVNGGTINFGSLNKDQVVQDLEDQKKELEDIQENRELTVEEARDLKVLKETIARKKKDASEALPNKNTSFEDLIEKGIEYEIMESEDAEGNITVSKKNISKWTQQNMKKQALGKVKGRHIRGDNEDDDMFDEDFRNDPYSFFEDDVKQEHQELRYLVDEKSSDLMRKIMTALSVTEDVVFKKCVVTKLLSCGFHYKCRSTFRLLTEFDNPIQDYGIDFVDETKSKLIEDNKFINGWIETCIEKYDVVTTKSFEEFLKECMKFAVPGKEEALRNLMSSVQVQLQNDSTQSVKGNLVKYLGNATDTDGQLIIDKKYLTPYKENGNIKYKLRVELKRGERNNLSTLISKFKYTIKSARLIPTNESFRNLKLDHNLYQRKFRNGTVFQDWLRNQFALNNI